jgi:hypothetical protein
MLSTCYPPAILPSNPLLYYRDPMYSMAKDSWGSMGRVSAIVVSTPPIGFMFADLMFTVPMSCFRHDRQRCPEERGLQRSETATSLRLSTDR